MLSRDQIEKCFVELNEMLRKKGQKGEIGIVGGAVMCLVFNARNMTRDVDAIFEPSQIIRDAAISIADKFDLPPDWLNDAAKGFIVEGFKKVDVSRMSNLLIWAPEPRYMLAMKCMSARWDGSDKDDVIFLLDHLGLKKPEKVFSIIESYYPQKLIPAKTKFFIEEVLG
jgi:hypothetical protein